MLFPLNCRRQTFSLRAVQYNAIWVSQPRTAHGKRKTSPALVTAAQLRVLGATVALGHPVQAMLIRQKEAGGQKRSRRLTARQELRLKGGALWRRDKEVGAGTPCRGTEHAKA